MHRRKEKSLGAGILPKKKGRPCKDASITEYEKSNKIKRLRMENELLKSFLHEAERWNAKV
jgi:hypothetical protein